jgi:ribosomal protein S18 acetylase RimI-like enzyme
MEPTRLRLVKPRSSFVTLTGTGEDNIVAWETRILHSSDRAMLENVVPGVFDNVLDPSLVAEFLGDDRHHLAVVVDGGQVIGFASGVHYVHLDKPSEMWINEVGVAADRQGRGIGKAVIQTLLQHGERLGCREAWVLTDRSNQAAMRLCLNWRSRGSARSGHVHVLLECRKR